MRMPWFVSCNSELKVKILSGTRLITFGKGEIVISAGHLCDQYIGILNGLLTLRSANDLPKQTVFGALCAADWYGADTQVGRSATSKFEVVAERETETVIVQPYAVEAIAKECPAFNKFATNQLALRFEQALELIHIERIASVEQRLSYFLNSATLPPRKGIKLSQEEMGLFTGLSRQSINKAWQSLQASATKPNAQAIAIASVSR
jgi:CRP/FNR family transcriptional regulator, cyclic AMP receptor protein